MTQSTTDALAMHLSIVLEQYSRLGDIGSREEDAARATLQRYYAEEAERASQASQKLKE